MDITNVIIAIASLAVGAFGHSTAIKVSFKQRTIDAKIKYYEALIEHWLKTRNEIYAQMNNSPTQKPFIDPLYAQSLFYIGGAMLISEDDELLSDILKFNDSIYRVDMSGELKVLNSTMDNKLKEEIELAKRMRLDIQRSSAICIRDILPSFCRSRKRT